MPIGILQKAGYRVEGAESGAGLADSLYPANISNANDEEVELGEWDALPFKDESLSDDQEWEQDETVEGHSGTPGIDSVLRKVVGGLNFYTSYNHITQILALACGFEHSLYPTFLNRKIGGILTILSTTAFRVDNGGGDPLILGSDDIGKYIRIMTGDKSYQVRKINDIDDDGGGEYIITIDQAFSDAPAVFDYFEISGEFQHQFELSRNMNDELWIDCDGDYPDNDVYLDTYKIIRRGTLGISKIIRGSNTTTINRSTKIDTLVFSGGSGSLCNISLGLIGFDKKLDSGVNPYSTDWDVENFEGVYFKDATLYIASYSQSRNIEQTAYKISIKNFKLNINNSLKNSDPTFETENYQSEPGRGGKREVTLTCSTVRLTDTYLETWFRAGTVICGLLKFAGNTMTDDDYELEIYIYRGKIINYKNNISGSGNLTENFQIQAVVPIENMTYFPVLKEENGNSEIVVILKNQVFFNPYMDQNYEY
jgi:hypothetical protein